MKEKKSSWANIGAIYISGKVVPISGIYEFTTHFDDVPCLMTHSGNRVRLARGNTFPRHATCQRRVYWRLLEGVENGKADLITKAR